MQIYGAFRQFSKCFLENFIFCSNRQKKIPLRAFTEKDIIKTRFIYLDLNTSEKR